MKTTSNLKVLIALLLFILFNNNIIASEVFGIYRGVPTEQNTLATDLTWYVFFDESILSSSLTTSDFNLNTITGNATGFVSNITEIYPSFFEVNVINVSGSGDFRLDFIGQVTDFNGVDSKNTFKNADIYSILPPVTVKSISRNSPTNQYTQVDFVTWEVKFDRAIDESTIDASDFSIITTKGQASGNILSVFGYDNTYYISVTNITKEATLRLDFVGFVTDYYGIAGYTPFSNGETYTIDRTPPKLEQINITSNNEDNEKVVYPLETVTVKFTADEKFNTISSNINGFSGINSLNGNTYGSSKYTFNYSDIEGPVLFSVTIADLAGNKSTFSTTTDGSYVNFEIPPPYVLLISQPNDIIECEGATDQFFFVTAAPSDKKLNVVYRWWKDGKPLSTYITDYGQFNFDSLTFGMSGKYMAEIFVFDKNYNRGPFSYESAKVSESVFTDEVNLYVLQKPSFLKEIPYQIVKKGGDYSMTFDANTYGEHNIDNPSYRTDIQWFKDTIALVDDNRIKGSKSSILTINKVKDSDYSTKYRVRLIGECDTVWSNEFALYDEPRVVWTYGLRLDWGCVGDTAKIHYNPVSTVPNISIINQWYIDGKILNDIPNIVEGSTNDTLFFYLDTNNNFNYDAIFFVKSWPEGYPNNYFEGIKSRIEFTRPPFIITDFDSIYTVEEGGLLELGILSTGTNRQIYWKKDNEDWFKWDDTLKIGFIDFSQAGKYQVRISNMCDTVYSRVTEVIVTPKQIITGIEDEFAKGVVNIYPNPLTDNSILNINPLKSSLVSVSLYDVLGNQIADLYKSNVQNRESKSIKLNVDELNLSSGTYYIMIKMGDEIETRQINVVR